MREASAEVQAALRARVLQARDFVWITGKTIDTGDPISRGWWQGLDDITAQYVDIDSGATPSRIYGKAGSLLGVDNIPLIADLTARNFAITLSQISQEVADLVRGYNLKLAPVEVHRGLFNPGTNVLVAPVFPRALAFVDDCEILDPAEGNDGQITLTCVSHTLELTRTNSDVRSDSSQQARHAGDRFYKYTGVAGSWPQFWGQNRGTIAPKATSSALQAILRAFGGNAAS